MFPEVAGNTRPQHLREPLEFKWPLELTGHWLSARIVSQPSQWYVHSHLPSLSKKEELINYIFKPLSFNPLSRFIFGKRNFICCSI